MSSPPPFLAVWCLPHLILPARRAVPDSAPCASRTPLVRFGCKLHTARSHLERISVWGCGDEVTCAMRRSVQAHVDVKAQSRPWCVVPFIESWVLGMDEWRKCVE